MKRRQKADSRASEEKTEGRRQKADSRASEEKTEGRRQKTEDRRQTAEPVKRRQKAEDRRQKADSRATCPGITACVPLRDAHTALTTRPTM